MSLTARIFYISVSGRTSCRKCYKINVSSVSKYQPTAIFLYIIIESVDSISRDEADAPMTQYITNAGITRAGYIITHFNTTIVFYGWFPIELVYNNAI